MRTKLFAATLITAVSLALSACGASDTSADGATFNDADVTFASEMIPHHEQATEMAELAVSRSTNPDVLTLASDIADAQGPEITTMSGWLKSWGKDVPTGAEEMAGMDHSGMQGMMSDSQMSDLAAASGSAFDTMFLTMMIEHHTGAIAMAKDQQESGAYGPAVDLATTIEADQTAEITLMRKLVAES